MKKITGAFIITFILALTVFAETADDNFSLIDEYTQIYGEWLSEGVDDSISKNFPKFSIEDIISDISRGKNIFSIKDVFSKVLNLLLGEIKSTLKLLLLIPVIVTLNTYITGLHNSFESKGAIQAAFFVCYSVMVGTASVAFIETVKSGNEVINNVSVFMQILIPVSLTSLASSGAIISATTFEIVLMTIIEVTQLAVEKLFLPIVMAGAALNIANNITTTFNAEKLVQLMNKTVKWGLGTMLTLFVGITGLQGIASGSADGLTVKVTKFATSNLIPMVGSILAETVETVMNCSIVIKNAIGITGIITVILMTAVPILKICACLILFRLCAALIQPIAEERWTKTISEFGDSVSSVLAMSVAVVVMFVIILTIIINVGNNAILFGR